MITKRVWVGGAVAALLMAVCGLAAPAYAKKTEAAQAAPADGVVNLNTATEEELTRLSGVGPTKAERIVAFRKKHGSFKKVDDLTKVKGFGRKTLKRLRPNLALTGPTTYQGTKKGGQRTAETAQAGDTP